jgi:cyclophilin family peptidyl-prolyl cis-trans isomerase
MKTVWTTVAVCVALSSLLGTSCSGEPTPEAKAKPKAKEKPVVIIETSMGTIKAELWPDKAPKTVANFLQYVEAKFFDGTIFHRVIPRFMIQGGGFTADMGRKRTNAAIQNEARSDTPNKRGTLAMARTSDINSATSQFFINLVDNGFLNHKDKTPRGFGYCVFGKVTEGMDVVDKIAAVATGNRGPHQNVPTTPVVMKSVRKED